MSIENKAALQSRAYKLSGCAYSHPGVSKAVNEDNFTLFGQYRVEEQCKYSGMAETGMCLAALCDGIGGASSGETASLIAVQGLEHMPERLDREAISEELKRVNSEIVKQAHRERNHMGCTFAGIYFEGRSAICCNVGDSSIYLLRDGTLRKMSYAHTLINQQLRLGLIGSEAEAPEDIKHTLTQHLGIDPDEFEIEPYFSEVVSAFQGDIFMICSDGLTDVVEDESVRNLLMDADDIEATAVNLVRSAMEKGSRDNITVIVLKVL